MRKTVFLLSCLFLPFIARADNDSYQIPPYQNSDPSISENFRNIYYGLDILSSGQSTIYIQNTSSPTTDSQSFSVSSGVITSNLGIGTQGISGKPDASLSIVNDGRPGDPSRQGIDIDATNNSVSKLPFLIFTNKSTPNFGIGGAIAFLQQMPSTEDIQQGILAYSQGITTHTASFQLYLRSGSSVTSNSFPVFAIDGKPGGIGVSTNTKGYGYAMFGPTGADNAGTPFGLYTPGAIVHVSSDFGDGTDGIRIERRATPNAARYGIRVDANGSLIVDTVGVYTDDPIIEILQTGQINLKGAMSSTRQIIAKGTTIEEDLGDGYVSQYISSRTLAVINMTTSGQYGNMCSVNISAGDWEVWGVAVSSANGATVTNWDVAISTYSGNNTTDHIDGWNNFPSRPPVVGANQSQATPSYRILTAANKTVYLKVRGIFTGGTPQILASVRGRRVH